MGATNENLSVTEQVPITFIRDLAVAKAELACLVTATAVAHDTETVIERDANGNKLAANLDVDGPGPWRVLSIAARFGRGDNAKYQSWVIDVAGMDTAALAPLLLAAPRPFGWNANFDRFVFYRGGISLRRWWDVMLFEAALTEGSSRPGGSRVYMSLAKASEKYLGEKVDGKATTRLSYDLVTALSDEQIKYAAYDAIRTLRLGEVLGAMVREAELFDTVRRECDAQPAVNGMTRHGVPIDVAGYRGKIDEAVVKAAEAAERIAVGTTGLELLTTVVNWATARGRLSAPVNGNLVDVGLGLLHDEAVFADFLADVTAQRDTARTQLAALTGNGTVQEDLFSEEPRAALDFDADNDVEVKKWLTKAAPVFAMSIVAARLREQEIGTFDETSPAELIEICGRRKQLTKEDDLGKVLEALRTSKAGDVTDTVRSAGAALAAYRRFTAIVATYSAHVGAIRLIPDWNADAPEQVKEMLNRYCPDLVTGYLSATKGEARLLEKADSCDADALTLIGGDLAKAILSYRENQKTVSTYGEKLLSYIHPVTGRIHGRYNQCLTGTGRLASFSPNMQNLSPLAKPYIRPAAPGGKISRVLVCADLSQAELRFAASQSQDENMIGAFVSGEDLHERTASLMFNLDMKELKKTDPKAYKLQRQSAKAPGFGYCYGLSGGALANQLTVAGIPTTPEEGKQLLSLFEKAYPKLAAWMAKRVAFMHALVESIRNGSADVDYEASWKLHLTREPAAAAKRALTAKAPREITPEEAASIRERLTEENDGTEPTEHEIYDAWTEQFVTADAEVSTDDIVEKMMPAAEMISRMEAKLGRVPTEDEIATERTKMVDQVSWALSYDASVILRSDGRPWEFESRTVGNRRRLFDVTTKNWALSMCTEFARSRKPDAQKVRDAWVEDWNAYLAEVHEAKVAAGKGRGVAPTISLMKVDPKTKKTVLRPTKELEKQIFDKLEVRNSFVRYILANMPNAREFLFRQGMADQVRKRVNEYRNHPIQGGVADAMEEAFAKIDEDLPKIDPTARLIQSVHDSAVIECDVRHAAAIREMVKRHMEESLALFCPGVPCRADADVQLSLDAETIVSDFRLAELVADLDTALAA